ncbi:MAG: hypothetical protein QXD48_00305 [Candidatus Aenigmatarchaeota archaeon]
MRWNPGNEIKIDGISYKIKKTNLGCELEGDLSKYTNLWSKIKILLNDDGRITKIVLYNHEEKNVTQFGLFFRDSKLPDYLKEKL